MSLDLNDTRRVCEDRNWRIQFSWQANNSFKNKVFVSQTIQSEKAKKGGFNNLVCASISCFVYDIFAQNGENSGELDDGKFGH